MCSGGSCAGGLMRRDSAPHQAYAGQKQKAQHDVAKILIAERMIAARAQPGAGDRCGERQQCEPDHVSFDQAARPCRQRAAAMTVQL